jgi:hypothetical protein
MGRRKTTRHIGIHAGTVTYIYMIQTGALAYTHTHMMEWGAEKQHDTLAFTQAQ